MKSFVTLVTGNDGQRQLLFAVAHTSSELSSSGSTSTCTTIASTSHGYCLTLRAVTYDSFSLCWGVSAHLSWYNKGSTKHHFPTHMQWPVASFLVRARVILLCMIVHKPRFSNSLVICGQLKYSTILNLTETSPSIFQIITNSNIILEFRSKLLLTNENRWWEKTVVQTNIRKMWIPVHDIYYTH